MGIEFSKGFKSAAEEMEDELYGSGFFADTWEQLRNRWNRLLGIPVNAGANHADGLTYVPYNGYPARLHEGERVLTASENRSYGQGTSVSVTVNGLTVREDADVDRISEALAQKISEARELAV